MSGKIFVKSLKVFVVRGFGAAASFMLTLVVTNMASSNEAGLFLFSLTLINVIGVLLTFGSPSALIRIVGANFEHDWEVINKQLAVIFKIVAIAGVVVTLILFLLSIGMPVQLFKNNELIKLLPFVGLCACAYAFIQIYASALQGAQKAVLASLVQNVIFAAVFILLVVVFSNILEITAIDLVILYLVSLISALCTGLYCWHKSSRTKLSYVRGLPRELKLSLYPLFMISLMSLSVQWAGQFAAARYLSSSDIAYFATAQRTALLTSFVLIAVNLVVAPKFARAFAKGMISEVNALSLLSSRLVIAMGLPVLMFMLFLPECLMSMFGEEYVVAAPLLQIIAVGQFVNVITGSVGYLLTMTNHEKDFRNVVFFSGPLAIVLAFIFTKEYGLIGAAYATAISVATQNLLAVYMVKKRLGFNTLNIFRSI